MALGNGSVAIDQISVDMLEANGCGVTVTTDQRGAPRAGGTSTTGGSACDVGAYEYLDAPGRDAGQLRRPGHYRPHPAELGDGERGQQRWLQPVPQRVAGCAG